MSFCRRTGVVKAAERAGNKFFLGFGEKFKWELKKKMRYQLWFM
jgi:hypothetical protein